MKRSRFFGKNAQCSKKRKSRKYVTEFYCDDEEDHDDVASTANKLERKGYHIYFYSGTNMNSLMLFSKYLQEITDMTKQSHPDMDLKLFKIYLHICSEGGNTFVGFALYDLAMNSPIPIVGIVEGSIASSATLLLMGCSERRMHKSSFMLIHQITSSFWGSSEQWKDENKNMEKLMKTVRSIYASSSGLTIQKLKEVLTRDLWWSPKKCKKYKLIDKII